MRLSILLGCQREPVSCFWNKSSFQKMPLDKKFSELKLRAISQPFLLTNRDQLHAVICFFFIIFSFSIDKFAFVFVLQATINIRQLIKITILLTNQLKYNST